MSQHFQHCAQAVSALESAIVQLQDSIGPLQLEPLDKLAWHELLTNKLKPQLGDESFLIVGVVGGTNIGKSVIFNHIAGGRISSTSPLASGTKHPTVLVPNGFTNRVSLNEIFPGFELVPWDNAEQPLELDKRHLLFWQESDTTPQNLVVLDTPDIDSVAEVNWERADHIRQSADVLIAVLTQQKYNDAAVKEFFRKAAHEDKLVIVVFNQCLLPEDEEYWPLWVGTFCEETGVSPHAVFLAPNDRRAAEENGLPFYERDWPIADTGTSAINKEQPHQLLEVLSQLRFGDIKIQTLRGALNHLVHEQSGVPTWLVQIEKRSQEFHDAVELLGTHRLVEIERWPTLPNKVLITQIRSWWASQREGWTANVHGFYNTASEIVMTPFRMWSSSDANANTPLDEYKKSEWETILEALDRALERLTWLRDLGNPLLSPRLDRLLTGTSRSELIEKFRSAHNEIDFETNLQTLIHQQLSSFKEDNPQYYKLFRRVDSVAAAARPAVSVALFLTGAGPMGDALGAMAAESALQGVFHVAGDAVGGTVVTAVGDKVITEGASAGTGYLEARFRQIHSAFATERANWMANQLELNLFGSLPHDLAQAAKTPELDAYKKVRSELSSLKELIDAIPTPTD